MRNLLIIEMIILILHQLALLMAEPLRGHMKPASIPFVASIATKLADSTSDRAHFCSGSLIATNLVLTSAHCLSNETFGRIDVVIGTVDLKGAQRKYDVESWITFDRWAVGKDPRMIKLPINDIAIIKLNSSVSGVTPANITTQRINDLYGKNARLIGWQAGITGRPRFLREAKVRVLETSNCQERFETLTNISADDFPEGYICTAANPFALTSEGDSGGPLLDDDNNILGVNYGICPGKTFFCSEEFADKRRFNLHVDFVDEYRQFIREIVTSSLLEEVTHQLYYSG